MSSRTLKVDGLARVEGEGALTLRIRNGKITDLKFRIFEPPRFFEAFLVGRHYREVPDITARICGICPIAYMLGSSLAMEQALGISVDPQIQNLRRLIYCGEWIESHVLHAAMLHAPDFLGLDDVLQIAKTNPELVQSALRLKKLGNILMEVIGGRAVHPINLRVGGFYQLPNQQKLKSLLAELAWARNASRELTQTFAQFPFPMFSQNYHCVSLESNNNYPIEQGKGLVSNHGLQLPLEAFNARFTERHQPYSNALHGEMRDGSTYLVGPLARFNNHFERLSPDARQLALECGLTTQETNPYKSILVRMVETFYACEEAIRLIEDYHPPSRAWAEGEIRAGEGYGCTEAPRGICFHHYKIDDDGLVTQANIIPPTAQNQGQIEADLRKATEENLAMSTQELTLRCEQTIRNYDPCISCATHFLKLTVNCE